MGPECSLGDGRIAGGLQDRFMEGSSATESCWNVAQGFRTARLGNDKGMKRRLRVSHDTLGEQLGHGMSPEGAARQCRGATWGRNVALETDGSLADYRTDLWRDLRLRNLAGMSLKGAARHAWGTIKV